MPRHVGTMTSVRLGGVIEHHIDDGIGRIEAESGGDVAGNRPRTGSALGSALLPAMAVTR